MHPPQVRELVDHVSAPIAKILNQSLKLSLDKSFDGFLSSFPAKVSFSYPPSPFELTISNLFFHEYEAIGCDVFDLVTFLK